MHPLLYRIYDHTGYFVHVRHSAKQFKTRFPEGPPLFATLLQIARGEAVKTEVCLYLAITRGLPRSLVLLLNDKHKSKRAFSYTLCDVAGMWRECDNNCAKGLLSCWNKMFVPGRPITSVVLDIDLNRKSADQLPVDYYDAVADTFFPTMIAVLTRHVVAALAYENVDLVTNKWACQADVDLQQTNTSNCYWTYDKRCSFEPSYADHITCLTRSAIGLNKTSRTSTVLRGANAAPVLSATPSSVSVVSQGANAVPVLSATPSSVFAVSWGAKSSSLTTGLDLAPSRYDKSIPLPLCDKPDGGRFQFVKSYNNFETYEHEWLEPVRYPTAALSSHVLSYRQPVLPHGAAVKRIVSPIA
ncbi:hypothetical protein FKM82_007596 [Ascaphus truei]